MSERVSAKNHKKCLVMIQNLKQNMDKIDKQERTEKIATLAKKNRLLEEIIVPPLEKLKT